MKVGDVCEYYFDNGNKSKSIVQIVKIRNEETAVIKFLEVIEDDSGNGLFNYLCRTGQTMTASLQYLHKINNQKQ